MVEFDAGRLGAAKAALQAAAEHYAAAYTIARNCGADDDFYPAKDAIACELRRALIEGSAMGIAADRIGQVRKSMDKAASERPDFWSVVGQTELSMLVALAAGKLAPQTSALIAACRELKTRVPANTMWHSVYNEAQFTLEPYQGQAKGEEARAAAELLAALAALAVPTA